MLDALVWFFSNIAMAFYNVAFAITHPASWLAWVPEINASSISSTEVKESLQRFVYYGGSVEFFFVVFTAFLVITGFGFVFREFLWKVVIGLEAFANTIGRVFAWAGLIMVLQQVLIVILQRIFAVAEISIGIGMAMTFDVSWWAEGLKLYNALIVALCCTYTFVQGSHVRVDLFYAPASFNGKKWVDMLGSLLFIMPMAVITWMYAWYFLWRHLIVPNPSASDTLDRLITKARALRWNVETIGFSPNGFNAYWIFKLLLLMFAGLIFIHACAFFWRSYLEWIEGEEAHNKYLDRDKLGDEEAELVHAIEENH